jgi:membrane protein implicated in regulation of membrane protease activity
MDEWVIWLIVAVAFAVGEILNLSFFLFPFAIGALGAAILSLVGAGTPAAFAAFAVLTAVSFAIVRPIARRHVRMPAQLRTGTAALVGRSAVVLEPIDNDANHGTVRLDGETWSARAYDDDQTFAAGARVHVMEIRGATALVSD